MVASMGRENLGVFLRTRHIPRRGLPRVVPSATSAGFSRNYALTFPGGERDGDTCSFYTSDSYATFFE